MVKNHSLKSNWDNLNNGIDSQDTQWCQSVSIQKVQWLQKAGQVAMQIISGNLLVNFWCNALTIIVNMRTRWISIVLKWTIDFWLVKYKTKGNENDTCAMNEDRLLDRIQKPMKTTQAWSNLSWSDDEWMENGLEHVVMILSRDNLDLKLNVQSRLKLQETMLTVDFFFKNHTQKLFYFYFLTKAKWFKNFLLTFC